MRDRFVPLVPTTVLPGPNFCAMLRKSETEMLLVLWIKISFEQLVYCRDIHAPYLRRSIFIPLSIVVQMAAEMAAVYGESRYRADKNHRANYSDTCGSLNLDYG